MSLSFIKSAVLSSTDGVSHNEETTIDSKEAQSLRASGGGAHKPLFEQLRANQDAEQEKDDEFQRSIRGTRPLDEEDCAHLDSVERMKSEREHAVKSGIEQEVALFRAAKEDRGLAQTVVDAGGDDGDSGAMGGDGAIKAKSDPVASIAKKEVKKIVPKFTIKKKRKRVASQAAESDSKRSNDSDKNNTEQNNQNSAVKKKNIEEDKASPKASSDSDSDNNDGGLLGLGCYGSDSD